jgi:hypothetical protein
MLTLISTIWEDGLLQGYGDIHNAPLGRGKRPWNAKRLENLLELERWTGQQTCGARHTASASGEVGPPELNLSNNTLGTQSGLSLAKA